MEYNTSKDDYKESWLATRLELIEAHDKLAETIDELEENEGIMKAIRRQRDEAEAKLDKAEELIGHLIEELEFARNTNDEAAVLEVIVFYRRQKEELFGE